MAENLFEVHNLSKHFVVRKSLFSKKKLIHAVRNVTFDVAKGESLGFIGESGSGKTTLANLMLGLIKPSKGRIVLFGQDITHLNTFDIKEFRSRLQIVFQYTHAVLDPKMTIEELLSEPLKIHKIVSPDKINDEVDRLMGLVGLPTSEKSKFPYQLSGGQNQRILIARAISTRPEIIICDEPVSALDVSVQGQILNLLLDLKKELGLTYVFISHDLSVIKHMCSRLAVMYKGEIVEIGKTEKVLTSPGNDYAKQLVHSVLK